MRILGIDPGLADIGFGVIERAGRGWRAIECGTIKTRKDQLPQERMAEVSHDLRVVIAQHQPNHAVVEYYHPRRGTHADILVLHVRGVILLGLEHAGLTCSEPKTNVWRAALLHGKASDHEVMEHVRDELGMADDPPSNHAADALGMALYYARFVA